MSDKILIKNLPNEVINGRTRLFCIVKCPDCNTQRKVRKDSYKIAETTLCRSCNNLRRPKKDPSDLFNYTKFYRSPAGKASHIYTAQVQKCKERNYSLPKYTRRELVDYLLNSSVYLELFKEWELSGFARNSAPSVDRLNDYKTYSFDNIQIITWKENDEKYANDTLIGKTVKTCKAVDQLDLNGNFIKRYYSQQEAGRQLNIPSVDISKVCCKKRKLAGGYNWRFSEVPNSKKEIKEICK